MFVIFCHFIDYLIVRLIGTNEGVKAPRHSNRIKTRRSEKDKHTTKRGSAAIELLMSSNNKRDASEMTTSTISAPRCHVNPRPLSSRQRGGLETLLSRKSPFSNESGSLPIGEFEPSESSSGAAVRLIKDAQVLVIGAGGLGCELLKDLAMSCVVEKVVVIDLGE